MYVYDTGIPRISLIINLHCIVTYPRGWNIVDELCEIFLLLLLIVNTVVKWFSNLIDF